MKGTTYHFYPAITMYFLYLSGVICTVYHERSTNASPRLFIYSRHMLTCLVVSAIINYPFQLYPLFTSRALNNRIAQQTSQLLDNDRPAKFLYCFCTGTQAYPLITSNGYRNVSIYANLWLVSALDNALDYNRGQPRKQQEYLALKQNFIHQIVSDFITVKPDIVIKEHIPVNRWGKPSDIFGYFSTDPRFEPELANYTLMGEIRTSDNWLTIYQRK